MKALQVTVLITTHNYGQFVEQAVDSVLSQDFPLEQIQILIVDDGSTDDTSERIKKYGSRVEYFYKANGGQASALNFGFEKARGEIIALLDADDFFLPGKLARLAEAFGGDSALGMVYHRLKEWHMTSNTYSEWDFLPISGGMQSGPGFWLSYVPHPTSCLAFRRALVRPFFPIPEEIRMLADCFPAALIPFLAPILAIPEFLSVYRIHRENSYYASDQNMPLEVRKARLRMWRIVIPTMFKWLADNGFTRKELPTRLFLDRWKLFQEKEEFLIEAPGRVEFFRHLTTYIRCYGSQMSRRLRMMNYISAMGALVVGYKHFGLLDKGWRAVTDRLGGRGK
jgi:glycosyltransferase involved in cell wall biosynthesis